MVSSTASTTRLAALRLLAVGLLSAGCASVESADPIPPTQGFSTEAPSVPTTTVRPAESSSVPDQAPEGQGLSPLAALVEPLPSATGVPDLIDGPRPIEFSFEAIGVAAAPIDAVGVVANGEMEIPGADGIGWYEYGAVPGEAGSAVLAAHIAFDGEDGVFRRLGDSQVGQQFSVRFDNGDVRRFEIVDRAQYAKDELPFDQVFARDGAPIVTLISCGGTFQRSLNSYADNIVAYAVEIDTDSAAPFDDAADSEEAGGSYDLAP